MIDVMTMSKGDGSNRYTGVYSRALPFTASQCLLNPTIDAITRLQIEFANIPRIDKITTVPA